jgi:hypothetical protein
MIPDKRDPPKKTHLGKKGPQPPSLTEFMRQAEYLRDTALALLQQDGHHAPMLFTWRRDGVREVVALELKGFPGSMGDLVQAIVKVRQVFAFVAISEAWMTRDAAASLDVMPSKSPDREEALVVSAIHPERKMMWCIPFSREHGRITFGAMIDSTAKGMTIGGSIPSALGKEGQP